MTISLDYTLAHYTYLNCSQLLFYFNVKFKVDVSLIGRGPLCEKVLRKAILWQPPGESIFCGSIQYSTIDAQLPQKVPKQKTYQTPRK
jgi:hypothetical protein